MRTNTTGNRSQCFYILLVCAILTVGVTSLRSFVPTTCKIRKRSTQRSVPSFVPQCHYPMRTEWKRCSHKENQLQKYVFASKPRSGDKLTVLNAILSVSPSDEPRPGSMEAARLETGKVPYGEGSRPYRRTVFLRSSDWAKHRNPDRLFQNLRHVFLSGIARQLARGIITVSSVALGVVVWNGIVGGFLSNRPELAGFMKVRLPPQPFSFSASALGLLLVFRTNSSYQRWLEGQNNITRIVSQLKNILRQSSSWLPPGEEGQIIIKELGLACWAVLRSLQNHLRSRKLEEASFKVHVRKNLDADVAEKLIRAKDRPYWAINNLSAVIEKMPIGEKSKREIDKSVTIIMDCIESCTKILRYPVPLVYTRHTARFLATWLLGLPLAMYDAFSSSWNHCALVPTIAVISFFFLGIDELAVQLEEPFSILPLEYSCALMKRSAKQALQWHNATETVTYNS